MGPTARSPTDAVTAPHPLIRPVTVPNDFEFPRTEGCEARSAATAEVIILLGLDETMANKNSQRGEHYLDGAESNKSQAIS